MGAGRRAVGAQGRVVLTHGAALPLACSRLHASSSKLLCMPLSQPPHNPTFPPTPAHLRAEAVLQDLNYVTCTSPINHPLPTARPLDTSHPSRSCAPRS